MQRYRTLNTVKMTVLPKLRDVISIIVPTGLFVEI